MPRGEPSAFVLDPQPLQPRLNGPDCENWADPDMGVLGMHRRTPPALPIDAFGPAWRDWILNAAEAAACPPDYVAAPLLSAVSTLVGHARWAQATAGWTEPPHLWLGVVGDSGNGKSPGADCLMRDVLPEIAQRMAVDFPDRLREWKASAEFAKLEEARWQTEAREAQKRGSAIPLPPATTAAPEPQMPRLLQHDVTIEKVAILLATAAPKGLLICRDELVGWIDGMTNYNEAGRAFWIEAYGGRPYSIERQKHADPLKIPRLAVAVYGSTQPDKIAALIRGADDGLLARMLWTWPEPIPFRLGRQRPGADWVIDVLDKLRELDLQPTNPARPIMVPLSSDAVQLIAAFGVEMQRLQSTAPGLLRSALGKARGQALRLSLVLEFMWWCAKIGIEAPPAQISAPALEEAIRLIRDYFVPMAERTYGDAAATQGDRDAAALARWIAGTHAQEVHVRHLLRDVRLPGLRRAERIHSAAEVLIEADWLGPPPKGKEFGPRSRVAYPVNPRLWRFIA